MPSLLSPKKIELASLAFFRLASCCEAVLEGMGSVWDKAADVRRHPVFAESAKEAVIAWGAPQAYMPEKPSPLHLGLAGEIREAFLTHR